MDTRTPLEIDTELAGLHEQAAHIEQQISGTVDKLYRLAGYKPVHEFGRSPYWKRTVAEMLQDIDFLITAKGDQYDLSYGTRPSVVKARYDDQHTQLARVMIQIRPLDGVFSDRGGWSRFFPCLNRDGHIHASLRACPTVRCDTRMGWYPTLSGKTVADAVAELGEALCSVCFPDAPANWKSKTLGQVQDDRTRTEREPAKAVREAAKAAKNLAPDEQFKDHHGWWVKTVAGARQALRDEVEFRYYYGRGPHPWHPESVVAAEAARQLLFDRGVEQAEIDKIVANAEKKHSKYAAES